VADMYSKVCKPGKKKRAVPGSPPANLGFRTLGRGDRDRDRDRDGGFSVVVKPQTWALQEGKTVGGSLDDHCYESFGAEECEYDNMEGGRRLAARAAPQHVRHTTSQEEESPAAFAAAAAPAATADAAQPQVTAPARQSPAAAGGEPVREHQRPEAGLHHLQHHHHLHLQRRHGDVRDGAL
ncbi:unnamed protein product, partial [Lampetra planeri]